MYQKFWPYIGIDESNHGRFPEIFVAVFSDRKNDISVREESDKKIGYLPKNRKHGPTLDGKLGARNHSFLLYSEEDKITLHEIDRNKSKGLVIASLLAGESLDEEIILLIDGELRRKERKFIKGFVGDIYPSLKGEVHLKYGCDFDRRCNLVHIADETAHRYFKNFQKAEEDVINNRNRKDLLYDLL